MAKKGITLNQWRKEYLRIVRLRPLAAGTIEEKARCAGYIVCALGKKTRLRELRPVHIAQVMREVWERGQQSRARRILVVARDMRGEFLRVWDNGRGIDSGRAFGTGQTGMLGTHSHSYNCVQGISSGSIPAFIGGNYNGTTSPQTGATGGTGTRPRNVAHSAAVKF